MKPAALCAQDAPETLSELVKERLRSHGISVPKKKTRGFMATPGRSQSSGTASRASTKTPKGAAGVRGKVFGRPLRDLMANAVALDNYEVTIPHFLSSILAYLKDHILTEGIFRKAGSAARQKTIRNEIEAADTFVPGEDISPLDAASLLKQWVRELPDPLIPIFVQEALASCTKLTSEKERESAILLCTLLLPPLHSSALSCIMRFLSEVASKSDSNKMDARSLAICFAPGLFTAGTDETAKKPTSGHPFTAKIDIVEFLIKNGNKVCSVEEQMVGALEMMFSFTSMSEDNLDGTDDHDMMGPSARRRRKKKRRSGSLSRVITATMKGISKAISRSATPAGTRSSSTNSLNVPETPDFATPAARARRLAPDSARRTGGLEAITPKVTRGRSISIKNRFRARKNEVKKFEPCVTPYKRPEPKINLALTPGTPSTSIPNAGQDLSRDSDRTFDDGSFVAAQRRREPKPASKASLSSNESFKSTRRRSSGGVTKKTTPNRHKIGNSRRRSREMIKQLSSKQIDVPRTNSLRRGKPNTFAVKPSPMKVEKTANGERTTRIKISFKEGQIQTPKRVAKPPPKESPAAMNMRRKISVNESLTNLRSDISSIIEQSFGNTVPSINVEHSSPVLPKSEPVLNPVLSTIVTRSQMRRQSSAFELPKHRNLGISAGTIRRQSSAFELAAARRNQTAQRDPVLLQYKASSVKDLVKKLEGVEFAITPKEDLTDVMPPPAAPMVVEPAEEDEFGDHFEDEWTDAKDFFNKPNKIFANVEPTSGCKRSSIIRIREKGLVSKNVETFTKPKTPSRQTIMGPPKSTPHKPATRRQTTHHSGKVETPNQRRLSARMGVAGRNAPSSGTTVTRRQTLTGIRTTTSTTPIDKRKKPRISTTTRTPLKTKPSTPTVRITTPQPSPKQSATKKAKRIEGRRHLTIAGFEGEMRSPLKEKQNLIASVQRSKSAQTPSRQKHVENRLKGSPYYRTPLKNNDENMLTPQSSAKKYSSKKHLSERVPTPKELPIALSLTSPASSNLRKSPRFNSKLTGY